MAKLTNNNIGNFLYNSPGNGDTIVVEEVIVDNIGSVKPDLL